MGSGLPDGPLGGLLEVALLTLVLGVTVGGVLYQHEIATRVRRIFVLRPSGQPTTPPIERIARDGRRLRAELRAAAPGTPMARRIGMTRAYDDLLVLACQVLEVPDTLTPLSPGTERDAERLHVEVELERAGLVLTQAA